MMDKNLKNTELTESLLVSSVLVSKYLREILWKESITQSDISTLKYATKMLERSINKIIPKEMYQSDSNQLELFTDMGYSHDPEIKSESQNLDSGTFS